MNQPHNSVQELPANRYTPMTELQDYASEAVTEEAESSATTEATIKTNIIEVENPSTEEMEVITSGIKANYAFDVDVKPINFTFKKSKDKDTGIETVRNAVQLPIPYVSVQGLIDIIEGASVEDGQPNKGLALLMEAAEGIVNTAARNILYEDTALNAANFPIERISWEAIANLPKAQRRGGGIPKEVWEAFATDYCEVMPNATGKTMDQVAGAAKILQSKFSAVKTNLPVLNLLVEQIAVYADSSENAGDYTDCIEFLLEKADTLLNVSEEELLAAL